MARLENCYGVSDFRTAARRRLPAPLFDYIDGGADDEITMAANTSAFDRYALRPHMLRGMHRIDTRRTVLGCTLDWPLILAPTGMTRLFHPAGEGAVATAAARSGAMYSLSTMATTSIEDAAKDATGAKMFQLYLLKDDARNFEIIDRCKAANYDALCLTVDTVAAGNRERDHRNGLTVPPRLTLRTLAQFLLRPGWCLGYLAGTRFTLPNIVARGQQTADVATLAAWFGANMEQDLTWARVERIASYWGKPFAIKGLQTADDAKIAATSGASAIILSNHGGRQLDGGAATIHLLADIVDAVGSQLEVILDGGVRRGTHIVKALAMGATACMSGRPYLYSLSAFGPAGVNRYLRLLRQETDRALHLLGCGRVDELSRSHIMPAHQLPGFLGSSDEM